MSHPPAIARVLDRCDVCGQKIHRQELVRTPVRYLRPAAQNLLPYSSYSASGWACDATDKSTLQIGTRADKTRFKVGYGTDVTILNGVQTWQGDGTYRTITSIDLSSATKATVSAVVEPYYKSQEPLLQVTMGLCDSDGANKTSERSWVTSSGTRMWYTVTVADIATPLDASAVYIYFDVTPETDQYWAIEDAQVELDATGDRPGEFVKTSGAAVTTAVDTETMTMRKVCPRCYEPLMEKSEQFGRPRREVEPPIPDDMQSP